MPRSPAIRPGEAHLTRSSVEPQYRGAQQNQTWETVPGCGFLIPLPNVVQVCRAGYQFTHGSGILRRGLTEAGVEMRAEEVGACLRLAAWPRLTCSSLGPPSLVQGGGPWNESITQDAGELRLGDLRCAISHKPSNNPGQEVSESSFCRCKGYVTCPRPFS